MKKLAILSTHPIQYYAPVFRLLAARGNIAVRVFYSWGESSLKKYDPGFGRVIEWDIPLLEGYDYEFLENSSKDPGTHHFWGIVNPLLRQRIDAWKPDALLVIGWNFHSHLQAMRHYRGRLPVLFRGDSTLLDEQPGWRKIARRLALRWVYRHVDVALYVGTENKKYFLAHGLRENQLVFAPHAIDNERFADNDTRRYGERARAWRRELGFADADVVVLYAGKLERKKNPALLLEAVKAYNALYQPALKLLFIGNGEEEANLKEQAAADPNTLFLDFQNQSLMPVIYRLGDIFCLPSQYQETWGLAVNEAMACGKPVIVSNKVGCAADLAAGQAHGFVFRSNDETSLLAALKTAASRLSDQPGQISHSARQHIQNWDILTVVQSIESHFHLS